MKTTYAKQMTRDFDHSAMRQIAVAADLRALWCHEEASRRVVAGDWSESEVKDLREDAAKLHQLTAAIAALL